MEQNILLKWTANSRDIVNTDQGVDKAVFCIAVFCAMNYVCFIASLSSALYNTSTQLCIQECGPNFWKIFEQYTPFVFFVVSQVSLIGRSKVSLVRSSGGSLFLNDNWSRSLILLVICHSPVTADTGVMLGLLVGHLRRYWGSPVIQKSRLGGPTAEIW